MTLLELFGGIGAIRKAIENLGIDLEWHDYVEIDKTACSAYNIIFNESFEPKSVLDYKCQVKDIDLLCHGSPCQDFSVAGKRDLEKGRSLLYLKTIDIVNDTKPKIVIWENVKNILSKENITHVKYYIESLKDYNSYYKVLNSLDFGVPQSRERVFVVSIRKDLDNNKFNFDNLEKIKTKHIDYFLNNINKYEQGKLKKETNNYYYIDNSGRPNGQFNRVWKFDKHIGTIACVRSLKLGFRINENIFWRYLEPKEAWNLMGFGNDYEKVSKIIPESKLYKLAGNSIVVNVLEQILKKLLF